MRGWGWRSLAIDAGLEASDAGLAERPRSLEGRHGPEVHGPKKCGQATGGRRIGVTAVTVSVTAHGPGNAMISLGCVGVSAVEQ
jgi:hypothetical protein